MKLVNTLVKPLSIRTRRNMSRLKTIAIILLSVIVFTEYNYRVKNEHQYFEQISTNKSVAESLEREIILLRNSIPFDIKKMGRIISTINGIQLLVPKLDFNAAEYYATLIVNESDKYDNVEAEMLIALIKQESHFIPNKTSVAGAVGLAQIMPMTGKWIIEDKWQLPYNDSMLFKPEINIKVSAWYISYLITEFSNFKLALAYYNGGFWQAKRYGFKLKQSQGIQLSEEEIAQLNKLHPETEEYVPTVFKDYKKLNELYIKKGS